MDISDWQMSWVGLGIIQRGQDYKALTVLYWSLPLSFVGRGTSSDEALDVGNKNRTAVYPLFSPCTVLRHLVLFAPHIEIFYAVFVYLSSISLVSFHILERPLLPLHSSVL